MKLQWNKEKEYCYNIVPILYTGRIFLPVSVVHINNLYAKQIRSQMSHKTFNNCQIDLSFPCLSLICAAFSDLDKQVTEECK